MKIKHTTGNQPVADDVKVRIWVASEEGAPNDIVRPAKRFSWDATGYSEILYYETVDDNENPIESQTLSIENTLDNYTFTTEGFDTINFQKIMDDLSYANPLRIVEFEDTTYAIVHHTIADKASRSEFGRDNLLPMGIASGMNNIDKSEISALVKDIRKIKEAKWLPKSEGKIEVKVTKVNV